QAAPGLRRGEAATSRPRPPGSSRTCRRPEGALSPGRRHARPGGRERARRDPRTFLRARRRRWPCDATPAAPRGARRGRDGREYAGSTARAARTLHSHAVAPDWDFVIVGSGFGGSVSALRLVEKGYRVLVLEKGRRFRP